MKEHFKLLGFKVRDKVSGLQGVVTCISFDLNGCVQALVSPGVDKDGKFKENRWIDTKALVSVSRTPIMEVPSFTIIPGGQKLPVFVSNPTK